MITTTISVDLPSVAYPPSSAVTRMLRWIWGSEDPQHGREHITTSGLVVLERLLGGLEAAGFNDIIAVLVDRKPVYIDTQHRLDDIGAALERTVSSGALKGGFKDVHLVASQPHDGVHSLADVTVNDEVLCDDHEIKIRWSTRISELRVQPSEGPIEYQRRVQAALTAGAIEDKRRQTEARARRLVESLRAALDPATVHIGDVRTRVVVPGPTQVGRFRNLGFRGSLRPRIYRPEPKDRRVGAYDDPHVYYYFDPYHDLLSWIMVREAESGRWNASGVEFVHRSGNPVEVAVGRNDHLELPASAVAFRDDRLDIDESIPGVGFDVAEAGSPHAPGWGGDNG